LKPLAVVVSRASPVLRRDGYRRFGPTFNSEREPGLIHVVNFQGSKWGDEFTVNLGVQIRELWELETEAGREVARRLRVEMPELFQNTPAFVPDKPSKYVFEFDCQLRIRLGQLIPPHRDTWWKYSRLEDSIKEVTQALADRALPYLESYASRSDIGARWLTDSPMRFEGDWLGAKSERDLLLKARLLKDLGRGADADHLIARVLKKSEGERWHDWAAWVAKRLGSDANPARLTDALND
jgi:uncharacterized protein DUF4304